MYTILAINPGSTSTKVAIYQDDKAVRELTPEQIEGLRQSAQHYIDNARRFQRGLRKIG